MNVNVKPVNHASLAFLLRVASLVVLILAVFVAAGHLDWGTWQEWVTVAWACFVGSTIVPF